MFFSSSCSILEDNKKNIILKDIDECYNSFLNNWLKLFKELNLISGIELCNLVTYLLYNGYFSKEHVLYYQVDDRLNLSHNYAFDIMNGKGVCLNFSCLLEHFLDGQNILVSNISVDAFSACLDYKPNIKKNKITLHESFTTWDKILYFLSNTPNHSCALICDDNMMYIYDITNYAYLKITNMKKADIIGGDGLYKLRYKFDYANAKVFAESEDNFNLNISVLENMKNYNEFLFPSKQMIVDSWEKIYDLFNKNTVLFEDCYFESLENVNKIANYVEQERINKKILKK